VKHGAIADASYLDWMVAQQEAIVSRDPAVVMELVRRSIEIKAGLVGEDTVEAGPRALLNFGHTIAHAIERLSGYAIAHGQAVAIGMVVEARIGEGIGVTKRGTADRLSAALQAFGLPTGLPAQPGPGQSLLEATRSDKKVRAASVRYALIEEPGRPARSADGDWTIPVPDADVLRATEVGAATISLDETDI
jgi:3-dehydroquinate synthase